MDPFNVAPIHLKYLIDKLTPRQLQIVELLARGHSSKETASLLSISPETVKSHIRKMCHKLDADNRTQVIVIYAMWRVTRL
jgi:DNA-binding CsgD family transcriptional regulator